MSKLKSGKTGGRVKLLSDLRAWRDEQARREGVEAYRVLPNATLDALVRERPETMGDLLRVKGIKEAKQRKYGKAILEIVGRDLRMDDRRLSEQNYDAEEPVDGSLESIINPQPSDIKHRLSNVDHSSSNALTVSQFLDGINIELSGMAARVRSEVSSVSESPRAVYFSLKDTGDESVLNCVIFRYQYEVSGITLAEGDEVIVEGVPEIYKPYGKFNLRVGVIEYAGEGAMRKAYEMLLKKLDEEGLFAPERKRPLPTFPERIALITSPDGAAIGDFTTNLGRNGLHIDFYPTAVEGKRAVFEIIDAIQFFNRAPGKYDCLVLVRGGGSFESLQAFNTEALVRAVAESEIPVLAGIGHERDVTLAARAADLMVSTPTAAAKLLATPWDEARHSLSQTTNALLERFKQSLIEKEHFLRGKTHHISEHFQDLLTFVNALEERFVERIVRLDGWCSQTRQGLPEMGKMLYRCFHKRFEEAEVRLAAFDQTLRQYDPERLLALGYSLVRSQGAVIRSIRSLGVGDQLDIQMSDGTVQSEVKEIREKQ